MAAAPETPHVFPVATFEGAAKLALRSPLTPTHQRALEALTNRGTILDVGAGGGASSLPIASRADRLIAVDSTPAMLDTLRRLAPDGLVVETVEGRWPDAAPLVGRADVVVCAHVAYNVPDLDAFVAALTDHASNRVVLELTETHPQARLSPLWRHFWNVERPSTPVADDAIAVIRETVGADVCVESARWVRADAGLGAGRTDQEIVAFARRRLCLPASSEPEVARLLGPHPNIATPEVVTVWWPGTATP